MELKINIAVDTAEIQKRATEQAMRDAHNISARQVELHFATGQYTGLGQKKGLGYLAIQEQIDNLLLSDETNQKIREITEKNFDRILEEAVIYALTRKARKQAQEEILSPGVKKI